MISSTSNPQIKNLQKLQKKAKYRRESKNFIVEGKKLVEEAKGHILRVYLSESYLKEEKLEEPLSMEYPVEVVTDNIFFEISDTMTPQGILAVVKMPEYSLDTMLSKEKVSLILLEDLQDPGNLGTIMRTAEGSGMDGIILSKDSVDLFNPKTVRSTMGSIFRVPFYYAKNFMGTMQYLKEQGVVLYAAHLKGSIDFDVHHYADKCGILIGNEANGLTDEAAQTANCLLKIPMEGSLESLNASVAAALMMYKVYGQRRE